MTQRHRLANRRALETIAIEHDGQRYKISLGREFHGLELLEPRRMDGPFGPVLEVFINAQQVNSNADVLASDGAILMSLLLQHGCAIETINHAMKRNPDGSPSSPLGRAAALIASAGDQR